MTVTYVVLAHKGPQQVARLAGRLTQGGHRVLLHVDGNQDVDPFVRALDASPRRGQIEVMDDRVRCRWGDYSLVEAAVRGTRQALETDPDLSHVVLLSGQDYPIKDAETVTAFFERHRGATFMFAVTERGAHPTDRTGNLVWFWNGKMDRLGRRHYRLGSRSFALPNRLVPWWPMRAMPVGLRPVQGSQWWALHREAAAHLVSYLQANPGVVRFFRRGQIPDENVAQMVIDASVHRDSVVQDDLHHVTWVREHPKILGPEDVPAMLTSPKLFARKFDDAAVPGVLDQLDAAHASRSSS